jgi:hypothetical protein
VNDLVEWLTAALNDDERAARDCIAAVGAYREGEPYEDGSGIAIQDAFPSYPWGSEDNELTFMAGPGHPARVLAEVAAKRRILDRYRLYERLAEERAADGRPDQSTRNVRDTLRWAVELLALPYAGRDGWREEWAPELSGP